MSAAAPGGDAPVTVHCDELHCYRTRTGGQTFDEAYKLAIADGWKVKGALAVCPKDHAAAWGCDVVERDGEGRVWECLAPPDHRGQHFLSQVSGPPYDPGDYGGMST